MIVTASRITTALAGRPSAVDECYDSDALSACHDTTRKSKDNNHNYRCGKCSNNGIREFEKTAGEKASEPQHELVSGQSRNPSILRRDLEFLVLLLLP